MKQRSVENILAACIDSLKRFPDAIREMSPKTQVQLWIVHQICSSLRHVPEKDKRLLLKASSRSIKPIIRIRATKSYWSLMKNGGEEISVLCRRMAG